VIITGLEVKEGNRRKAMEKILKEIGVEVKVKEVWKITGVEGKEKESGGSKNRSGEEKRDLGKKLKLRGRKERILEDWTWRERRMR